MTWQYEQRAHMCQGRSAPTLRLIPYQEVDAGRAPLQRHFVRTLSEDPFQCHGGRSKKNKKIGIGRYPQQYELPK